MSKTIKTFEKFKTAIPIPPGFTISHKLEYLGMTQKELAARLGCSEKHVSQIINGKAEIERDLACRLSNCIGIDADILLKLEIDYRQTLSEVPSDEELEEIKKFPYNTIVKIGYVPKAVKTVEKVFELRKFFGVSNFMTVSDFYSSLAVCSRKQATEKPKEYYLYSWMRQAEILRAGITVPKYNNTNLMLRQSELKECSVDNDGNKLIDICAECGVILLFSEHIPDSGIYAITFKKNENYIVMLSVRNKVADQFWFSFFHEMYHVLFDKIKSDSETEIEADKYAADFLIPPKNYGEFTEKKDFSLQAIRKISQKLRIHPCIVVGRLKRDEYINYNDTKYNILVPKLQIN
jgi:HTH-type transcriptional regulator/antitoxin HigA